MSSLPSDVASGAGTLTDPYVLESNSGTVTLESGKFYVLESGTTIGTKVGSNSNTAGTGTSSSTGGIVVNGASLEVQDGSQINGTLDLSASGSSVMMDTPSSWVLQTNLPGHSAVGGETYGYPALQNAVVSGLLNSDGSANSNVSFIMNGVPGTFERLEYRGSTVPPVPHWLLNRQTATILFQQEATTRQPVFTTASTSWFPAHIMRARTILSSYLIQNWPMAVIRLTAAPHPIPASCLAA